MAGRHIEDNDWRHLVDLIETDRVRFVEYLLWGDVSYQDYGGYDSCSPYQCDNLRIWLRLTGIIEVIANHKEKTQFIQTWLAGLADRESSEQAQQRLTNDVTKPSSS